MTKIRKLVAFDTNQIKSYVFATDTLKEITGASALLDQLNREVMPTVVKDFDSNAEEIYANGGGGLFLVTSDAAEKIVSNIERVYREKTGNAASVTGIALDLPNDFDLKKDLQNQNILRLLQLRLRQAKDCPPPALAISTLPNIRHCDACAEFPANTSILEYGATHLLCKACHLRRQSKPMIWERLADKYSLEGNLPQSFSELGEYSKPSGYIGLIYADGNSFGKQIESLKTLEQLSRFALATDNAIYQATGEAIKENLEPVNGLLPCVPLLLGGDDLVMVTNAQSAIKIAISLVEKFREIMGKEIFRITNDKSTQIPTLSASVILAHSKFPFRSMLDIAESALKFTKREAAKRKLVDRSLINFLVITSANHLDFNKYYSETLKYQPSPQSPKWLRTLRPYSPGGLRELIETAVILQDAPRNKLQALAKSVFLSHNQSILEASSILMRWFGSFEKRIKIGNSGKNGYSLTPNPNPKPSKEVTKSDKSEQFNALMRLVYQSSLTTPTFPWNGNSLGGSKIEWRTGLLDLVELFDFVKDG